MAEVFISNRHVAPDQDLARELSSYLTTQAVPHFIDTRIGLSQNWVEVIDRELTACNSLVVLLSADSIRSDMVAHEVKFAYERTNELFPSGWITTEPCHRIWVVISTASVPGRMSSSDPSAMPAPQVPSGAQSNRSIPRESVNAGSGEAVVVKS